VGGGRALHTVLGRRSARQDNRHAARRPQLSG
jgi:hypothetical protein